MSFDPIAYINEPRWQESRLGLDRIRALLERLGRPQDRLKFVHVAGTNGKGSVCSYLASVLQEAGYRTGLFTSPYIEAFEERIRVDGENIPLDELREVTLAVKEQAGAVETECGEHPTEFELMTAVALVHFARRGCDIVVLEVGLGGRLDSTNVIDAPEVAVIARIGLDHTKLLGNTLAAIAGEKAGIVKPGSAVASYPQEPEAMAVVERAAAAAGDPLAVVNLAQLRVGEVLHGVILSGANEVCAPPVILSGANEGSGVEGSRAASAATASADAARDPSTPALRACAQDDKALVRAFTYKGQAYRTRLLGSYQPANAALAIEAVLALRARGWDISDEAMAAGIERTTWSGRFEVVEAGEGRSTVVVDGGHNPQGARALVESLEDVFPGQKPVFIIGVLEDKDYPAMLETVVPYGCGFVCVTPDNPRALPAHKLARAIRWTGQDLLGCSACTNPYVARDMADALIRARQLASPNGLICAFGSLYSIAALKAVL